MSRRRYVVVGAGLAGSATAWQLARRGADVTVLEAYGLDHRLGSSAGSARIIRRAYVDRFYTRLTGQAWSDWRELEGESGVDVISRTGGLDFGADRNVAAVAAAQAAEGVPHRLFGAEEATERWPQFAFDGDVLHHPDAGVVDAGLAVQTMTAQAQQQGAVVHSGWPVARIEPDGAGYVLSSAAGQAPVRADVVVVAAGPWLAELLAALPLDQALLPPLRVTEQQVFHFRARERATWPVFLHAHGRFRYGLPGGADVGEGVVKVGEHDQGRAVTASAPRRPVDAASRDRMVGYVTRRLPGLVPEPVAEATCLYTNTPTEDFVLDRTDGLVVVSPCSGHGAKFAATIGRIAADLADGSRAATLPRFALRRRAAEATTHDPTAAARSR